MQAGEPRQRRQHLGGTNPTSPYFTSVGGQAQMPPPPPPPPAQYPYGSTNSVSSSGSAGYSPSHYGSNPNMAGSLSGSVTPSNNGGGYYGSSPPSPARTAHSSEVKLHAKPTTSSRKANNNGCSCFSVFFLLLLWTAVLAGGAYYYHIEIQLPKLKLEKQHLQQRLEHDMETLAVERERAMEHKIHQERRDHVTQIKTNLEQQVEQARRDKQIREQELLQELHQTQKQVHQVQEELQAVSTAQNKLPDLQSVIQAQSRRIVLEKFGPGPHRVELELHFPHDNHPWFVVLELAPLDEMPHTLHVFLEQVTRGLYNQGSFSFHHCDPRMCLGEPIPNEWTAPELLQNEHGEPIEHALWNRFIESGYGQVLFQEYSPQFPHQKYTLGMARLGRDDWHSGPGLYWNFDDNTVNHGPGGYASDGTGDPCFARAVTGLEVIDRIHASAGELNPAGDWKPMQDGNVAILSIKLL